MRYITTIFVSLLLAATAIGQKQLNTPRVVAGGSESRITISGAKPGESVTLGCYTEENRWSGGEANYTYTSTADSSGTASFDAMIPLGIEQIGFTVGGTATGWSTGPWPWSKPVPGDNVPTIVPIVGPNGTFSTWARIGFMAAFYRNVFWFEP